MWYAAGDNRFRLEFDDYQVTGRYLSKWTSPVLQDTANTPSRLHPPACHSRTSMELADLLCLKVCSPLRQAGLGHTAMTVDTI